MNLYCANNWVNMMGNNGDNYNLTYAHNSKGQSLPCLQRCELQSETLLLTPAQYPSKPVFSSRKDYCYILQKLARICKNRRKIFEASQNRISCETILKLNSSQEICSVTTFYPNATAVTANKNLTRSQFHKLKLPN